MQNTGLTTEQAVALAMSGWWKNKTPGEIVGFQLFEPKLCMDFHDFHVAVEKALGRDVFSHEFGLNLEGLRQEFLGSRPAPTFKEILDLIPEAKRLVLEAP